MKTTSSLLAGAVAAVVISASPLTFAQSASTAPDNNPSDTRLNGNNSDTSGATIATPTSNFKADQAVDPNMNANRSVAAPASASTAEPKVSDQGDKSSTPSSDMSKSRQNISTTAGAEKTKADQTAANGSANDQSAKTPLASEKTKADAANSANANDQSAKTSLSAEQSKPSENLANPSLTDKTHRTSTLTAAQKQQKEDKSVSKLDKKPAPSNSDKLARTSSNNSSQPSNESQKVSASIRDTTP